MNEKEFAELAAGAALHALSPSDAERFRVALSDHPEWREMVEADAEIVAGLAEVTAPVTPPAGIRAGLLDQIARMPQGDLPDEPASSSPEQVVAAPPAARKWSRSLLALAACLALLVGVGVGAVVINEQLNRPPAVVALEQIRSAADAGQASVELESGGTATAHWSASLGEAVLVADGIATLSAGETYELWFVRDETPISAGVFAVDDGEATALLQGDMHSGDIIAVTVEQSGGSPSGQPTSDPVIVIATA